MKLSTRIIACICILSMLISLLLLFTYTATLRHVPEYTEFTNAVNTTAGVYYSENWNKLGRVYNITPTGEVLSMMSSADVSEKTVDNLDVWGGLVYILMSSPAADVDGPFTAYRIIEADPDLRVLRTSNKLRIADNETPTGFNVDDGKCYISALKKDGTLVDVYSVEIVDLNELKWSDTLKNTENQLLPVTGGESALPVVDQLEPMLSRESPGYRYYVDAIYDGAELYLRTDHDAPTGPFAIDGNIKGAVDNISFTLLQRLSLYRNYVVFWFGCTLIWYILFFSFIRAIRRRNRFVYVMIVMEGVFMAVLGSSFGFVRYHYSTAAMKEYARFGVYSMQNELGLLGDLDNVDFDAPDFYSTPAYRTIQNSLSGFLRRGSNPGAFRDIVVVRLSDSMVMCGVSGRNLENSSLIYGSGTLLITDYLKARYKPYSYRMVNVNGTSYLACGVTDGTSSTGYALLALMQSVDPDSGIWGDIWSLAGVFMISFIIGSLLIFFAMWAQSEDIRRFEREIHAVALGKTEVEVPELAALDMQSMWVSLSEVAKRINEINFDKYKIFEAYYRFAPKNIEAIMGKDSIYDVKNGDYVRSMGSLLLIATENNGMDSRRDQSISRIISYIDRYSEAGEGILVSQDSSLSIMQFLFLEQSGNIIPQVVQLLHALRADQSAGPVTLLLYFDDFVYGVEGINEHSLIYLTGENSREMEDYVNFFKSLKVSMVITENIKERDEAGETRYIGYIKLSGNDRNVGLYEVLDACPARERQIKLINKERFESALRLFYDREFYQARNRFSDILKELPGDEITKWYLFECEKYLNSGVFAKESGPIRLEA